MVDCAKRLELRYLRNIQKKQFIKAAQDMMDGFLSKAEQAQYAEELGAINAAYQDVKTGDVYALAYDPEAGLQLFLNGVAQVELMGADFARDYFRIWIDPACKYKKFRDQLLGR